MEKSDEGLIKLATQVYGGKKFQNASLAKESLIADYDAALAKSGKEVVLRLKKIFRIYLKTSTVEECCLALNEIFPGIEDVITVYANASQLLSEEEIEDYDSDNRSFLDFKVYLATKIYEKRANDYDSSKQVTAQLKRQLELLIEKTGVRYNYEQAISYLDEYKKFIKSRDMLLGLEKAASEQIDNRKLTKEKIIKEISDLKAQIEQGNKKRGITLLLIKNKLEKDGEKVRELENKLTICDKRDAKDKEAYDNAENGILTLEKNFLLIVGKDYSLEEYENIINGDYPKENLAYLEKEYQLTLSKINSIDLKTKEKEFNIAKLLYGSYIRHKKHRKGH